MVFLPTINISGAGFKVVGYTFYTDKSFPVIIHFANIYKLYQKTSRKYKGEIFILSFLIPAWLAYNPENKALTKKLPGEEVP